VFPAAQPQVALDPNPQHQEEGNLTNRLQADYRKDATPWGSPTNHPGIGGKIAHVLSKVGNIAGDIFAPATMAMIPGTDLNRKVDENNIAHELNSTIGEESQNALQGANAAHVNAETQEVAPEAESQRGLQGAQARHLNDESEGLENPQPSFSIHDTEAGPLFVNNATGTAQHLSVDGAPVGPKIKLTQSQPIMGEDGKPHTYMLDEKGNKVADLGVHYERPMSVNVNTAEAADPVLVQQIGTGRMPVGRMSYLLARNPQLMSAVAQAYPDFDASKIEAYANTYKDFTSGKTSVMLNAGGTALGHLAELKKLNTNESHIPGTPDWTAYQNKADTVATELAKFYGDTTIPAIAQIKKTLASNLPGNRQRAIETQAQSMGDKIASFEQTWKNASPSKSYQAQMPGLSDNAYHALTELSPGGGNAPPRPANVPATHHWDANGPKGAGWYK
jgi:hypothetical protein